MKFLTAQSPPVPCHLVPLRPKYLPQQLFIKPPQPMVFPPCERPSCILIYHNRQINSSVYFNVYVSGSKCAD